MTNPVTGIILGRRSVREHFSRKPIERAILAEVLRCGLSSPSSKNAQPWRFHVIDQLAGLEEIALLVESAPGQNEFVPADPVTGGPRPDWDSTVLESAAVLRQVPCAIFIENRAPFSRGRAQLSQARREHLPNLLLGYSLEILGIGAAVQSLWIAARSLGLEGAFLGDVLIAEEAIRARLGIEGDLVGALTLGYCDQSPVGRSPATANGENLKWHQL